MVYQRNPTEAAFSRLGFDPTGVRSGSSANGGFTGDPTGVRNDIKGFGGQDPLLDYGMSAFADQLAKDQAAQQQFNNYWGGMPTGTSGMASLGGDWAGVDRWNTTIQAAASRYGVPANLIKAVMKLESNGDPGSVSVAGATGPMQVMPNIWNGSDGWNVYDPVENIMLGAYVLKTNYDQYGSWEMAAKAYLGLGGADAYGTTNTMYWDRVSRDWEMLNARGTTTGTGFDPTGGTGGGTGGGSLASIFPASQQISQEYAAYGGPDLYGYGTAYGLDGSQHTGLDVAMPVGSPYYAPMGGTVMCSGTGRGTAADGSGCAAFNDYNGQGAGRVEILLDNGAVLIYGHSSTANVRPGQRVEAGTLLGTSGGMNGPHIHLEARVKNADGSWRMVDPRSVIGSSSFAPGPGGSTGGFMPQQQSGGGSMLEQMWKFLTTPGASW